RGFATLFHGPYPVQPNRRALVYPRPKNTKQLLTTRLTLGKIVAGSTCTRCRNGIPLDEVRAGPLGSSGLTPVIFAPRDVLGRLQEHGAAVGAELAEVAGRLLAVLHPVHRHGRADEFVSRHRRRRMRFAGEQEDAHGAARELQPRGGAAPVAEDVLVG